MLSDPSGRSIRYLRLSLTRSCPLRCIYCRPGADAWGCARQRLAAKRGRADQSDDSAALLTAGEIERLVAHLVVRHGLRKVRLTGGDPTARPDLLAIIRRLAGVPGLSDMAMTTHGLTLSRLAGPCAQAGLRRVNVSLDSLDRGTFRRITGSDGPDRVLAGIDAALAAGLTPARINTVVMAGVNDHELPALVRLAAASSAPLEVRFIELMPMGPQAGNWPRRYVSTPRMRELLADTVAHWQPLDETRNSDGNSSEFPVPNSEFPSDSARRFRATLGDGSSAVVGFISPMDCPFCGSCDRLRIGCDGRIHPCLMDRPAGSILPALRPRFDPERLDALLVDALSGKAPLHPAAGPGIMTHIGG